MSEVTTRAPRSKAPAKKAKAATSLVLPAPVRFEDELPPPYQGQMEGRRTGPHAEQALGHLRSVRQRTRDLRLMLEICADLVERDCEWSYFQKRMVVTHKTLKLLLGEIDAGFFRLHDAAKPQLGGDWQKVLSPASDCFTDLESALIALGMLAAVKPDGSGKYRRAMVAGHLFVLHAARQMDRHLGELRKHLWVNA